MKALLHALLELSVVATIMAAVWAAPAASAWLAGVASVDEQLLCASWVADEEQFMDRSATQLMLFEEHRTV